jgi:hypothetical protein
MAIRILSVVRFPASKLLFILGVTVPIFVAIHFAPLMRRSA